MAAISQSSRRLWAPGASIFACNSPSPCFNLRSISFLSRTPSTAPAATAAAAAVAGPSANTATTTATSSSSNSTRGSSSSSSEVDVQVLQPTGKRVLKGEAADRISRAAAAVDERALRGGFVPSQGDAHLQSASQFGGPGAAAMSSMVEAVFGMFSGDSKSVERSVESLTHGAAGVSHKPLTTRWARAHVSVSSSQEDAEEAAAIRETLTAYRFTGMVPRAVTPEPEAPAKEHPEAEATPAEPAAAAAAGAEPVVPDGCQPDAKV